MKVNPSQFSPSPDDLPSKPPLEFRLPTPAEFAQSLKDPRPSKPEGIHPSNPALKLLLKLF